MIIIIMYQTSEVFGYHVLMHDSLGITSYKYEYYACLGTAHFNNGFQENRIGRHVRVRLAKSQTLNVIIT